MTTATAAEPMLAAPNAMMLRRRGSVFVPPSTDVVLGHDQATDAHVAAAVANFHAVGYAATPRLVEAMGRLSVRELDAFHAGTYQTLLRARGGHGRHRPMYPNFPAQVMDASLAELYLNAILHYWTDGEYLPPTEVQERMPLLDRVRLASLDLATVDDVERLFGQIVGQNDSMSEADRADVAWFVETYREDVLRLVAPLLPDGVPQRENRARLAALLVQHMISAAVREVVVPALVTTATDVLRLAAALCDGDVSLAEPTRYRLSREHRRVVVALLERVPRPEADLARHAERWKRLAHAVHVGELTSSDPTRAAIKDLRAGDAPRTLESVVEVALEHRNAHLAMTALRERPGYFARRLHHVMRVAFDQTVVAEQFRAVADLVPTPILLQLTAHFAPTPEGGVRVFFPKGNTARAQVLPDARAAVSPEAAALVVEASRDALRRRFAALAPMGGVYVDPALAGCPVPHAGRSASASARVVARGTRLPLPDGDTVRAFMWWKNKEDGERVDLDLSASLIREDFSVQETVAYYSLKTSVGYHSGDIIDAPQGASEFIDYRIAAAARTGARYLAITVNSYTGQRFSELECFAGWMVRERPRSGEIYDPRTVEGRVDVTSASRMVLPLLVDLRTREVVWCDMAVSSRMGRSGNNVHENRSRLSYALQAVVEQRRASLLDLLTLHAEARGRLVAHPDLADVSFMVGDLPFRGEEIASQLMANP